MRRRSYIATTTSALAVLAGCNTQSNTQNNPTTTSNQGSQSSGNPYFEDATITGPEEIAVGEEFTLTIEATNTGGRSGDFATQITANPQAFTDQSYQATIPDVAAGETNSTTLGPLVPKVAGEFRFISGSYSADHTLTVTPLEGSLGDTLTLPGEITITPESVEISRAYFYADTDTHEVYTPNEDNRSLVLVYLTVENTSDEPVTLPGSASFGVVSGEETSGSSIFTPDIDVDGSPYQGGDEVAAGESRSGWLLFEPRDTSIQNGVRLGYATNSDAPGEAYWTLNELSTGAVPPDFDITPETNRLESTIESEVVAGISNTGGFDSVYRDVLTLSKLNSDEVIKRFKIEQSVSAGKSATWTKQVSLARVGSTDARLATKGAWGQFEVTPAKLSTGESFTTETGIRIRVSDYRLTRGDPVKYEVGQDERTKSPDGQFLFAKVETENTGEEQPLPSVRDFVCTPDGEGTYEPYYVGGDVYFLDPHKGEGYTVYGDSQERGSGASNSGWVMFDIPRGVTFQEIVVRWIPVTRDVDGEAEWRRQH